MKNFKIVDKFLELNKCEFIIEKTIKNNFFPLYLKEGVSNINANDGIYFTHEFYGEERIKSNYFYVLEPILNLIKPQKLLRVQLNVYPKTFLIKHHNYHVDYNFPHKGLIYYLNSNNGKTILQNGIFSDKIKSVKNRSLFFEPHKRHKSTTCTNSDIRSNIIFNYL